MLLITILLFSLPPRGTPPELWPKYKSAIDLTKQTFKCLDGSKTINLTKFNDNYPDCADFSDEPGSYFESGTKFYCINKGWEPQYIEKWKVDDGVCDCCDCSDETNETNPNFDTNGCAILKNRKMGLVTYFRMIFQQGYDIYKNYSSEGEESYKRQVYEKARLDSKVSILEQIRQRVIDKKPYDDLKDPDDFIPYEDFIPPPKNLEEYNPEEANNEDLNTETDYNEMADYDDEYRYDRYYDYYRYNHYYNPEEFYRNDYTYEYVQPPEDPPTAEPQEPESGYTPDLGNYNPISDENTENSENTKTEEAIPESKFRIFFRKLWNITFLYPDQKYLFQSKSEPVNNNNNQNSDNYDYGYHPYDPETTAKVDAIDEKLNPARSDLYNYNQLSNVDASIDKAYFKLYKQSFEYGEYSITFFDEFKIGYEYLGSFKSFNESTSTMEFGDGSYCQSSGEPSSKSATVQLYCWSSDKLVHITRVDECAYKAVFLTPAACGDAMDRLNKMSIEQLENLNDITGATI